MSMLKIIMLFSVLLAQIICTCAVLGLRYTRVRYLSAFVCSCPYPFSLLWEKRFDTYLCSLTAGKTVNEVQKQKAESNVTF